MACAATSFATTSGSAPIASPSLLGPAPSTLAELEQAAVAAALRQTGGKIRRAAAALGIPKSTLSDRIRRHGLYA
jgi:two-component system C4-dicarboxylate transport response regulator DctD